MAEVIENGILIRDVETKNIMTKSSLPVGGYSINPYVGCTHGCRYCYASFMKRFTGHTEPWGTFLDVKHWPEIRNPRKYEGQRLVIGSVTDGYLPQEEQFQNTRKLLKQLKGSGAEILICTKSDLVVRDIDLLKEMGKVTVSWSINTLDEEFRTDMDNAVSIERRLSAMKQVYDAGIAHRHAADPELLGQFIFRGDFFPRLPFSFQNQLLHLAKNLIAYAFPADFINCHSSPFPYSSPAFLRIPRIFSESPGSASGKGREEAALPIIPLIAIASLI